MDVQYSADIDHIDDPLREAAAEAPGEPIRIRIQPSIYRRGTVNQQRAWAGVGWRVGCRSVEEAIALREAMRAFFELVERVGPVAAHGVLIVPTVDEDAVKAPAAVG